MSEKPSGKAEGEKKTNGLGLPIGWNTWPGINQVCRDLNVPASYVQKQIREGVFGTCVDPSGRRRIDPADVASCKETLRPEDIEERHEVSADGFKAGTDLVKQVFKHHETMVPLMVSGFEAVNMAQEGRINSLVSELQGARERITQLEKERDETAAKREEAAREEYERALVFRRLEAAETRKDRALDVLTNKVAPLLLHKYGLGDPRLQTGVKLLSTIKREQLLLLLAMGDMLGDEQRTLVLQLLGPLTPEEQAGLDELKTKKPENEKPA